MRTRKHTLVIGLATLATLALALNSFAARPDGDSQAWPYDHNDTRRALSPEPITVDQITHDVGNIVTTIDNYGYIGGYSYYGYPSGEWPRNSGRDYLAEVRYWMGCVTAAGDTLVANSYDDFQAMAMPVNGSSAYQIYLSTDTSRYYDYDPDDVEGSDYGRPAFGWRIWNADSAAYTYNQTIDPLSASNVTVGPISLQDSHYRFNDAADGEPLLGLELTHSVYCWNYCYNEDFMFVVMEITNTSEEDYTDFAFGLYIDIDVGGPDGTGENGRLGDLVAFDTTENLAWIYDEDAYDVGWGPTVTTGVMGTKYLETPDGTGMTSFRSDDWSIVSNLSDADRYNLINSQQFDESLPPTDQFYIQCTRGISLDAGKTVRVVYALIAGSDEDDFRSNAALAQELYDNSFIGPEPPATPQLSARGANEKVYLTWTDTSEVSLDPLTGEPDFVGYKLYRSDNQGMTWGRVNDDNTNECLDVDYHPVATYTIITPGDLIQHSYVDSGLYNGVEYWYCLAAFDGGDDITGVDALQTGFGVAGQAANVVAVSPGADPAGYYEAATTVEHEYTGVEEASDGDVKPIVFDESQLTGSEYAVTFNDAVDATYWNLINETTGDTLLTEQTLYGGEPGLFDVTEGLRVYVTNGEREPRAVGQTVFSGPDTTLPLGYWWGPVMQAFEGDGWIFSDARFRNSYELRVTGDSTRATELVWELYYGQEVVIWLPFEVWNTTTNTRVSLTTYDRLDNGIWEPEDEIAIIDYPYNESASVAPEAFPYDYAWMFVFDAAGYAGEEGDVFRIEAAPLNGPDDQFSFKVDGIDGSAASNQLANIKVVPNPYFARYSSMVETAEGESVLKFIKIPDRCTIRIYTLAGDLVRTIRHNDGTGEAEWDLLSSNRQQVASGTYLYHVESDYGEYLGRFAVIK